MSEYFDSYDEGYYEEEADVFSDSRVLDFLLNVDYISEQSKLARADLRIVRQMEKVAGYFMSEIDYARRLNLSRFIINYDENKLLYNFVSDFVSLRNIDVREFYHFKGSGCQGLELPISALLVSWLLPSDIRINVDMDSNGVIFLLK